MDDTGSGEFKAPLSVLEEAERLINGQRALDYGDATKMHDRVARLWTIALEEGKPITADKVAQLMRLLKEARLMETPDHRDSLIDIAGYVAIAAKILEGKK